MSKEHSSVGKSTCSSRACSGTAVWALRPGSQFPIGLTHNNRRRERDGSRLINAIITLEAVVKLRNPLLLKLQHSHL